MSNGLQTVAVMGLLLFGALAPAASAQGGIIGSVGNLVDATLDDIQETDPSGLLPEESGKTVPYGALDGVARSTFRTYETAVRDGERLATQAAEDGFGSYEDVILSGEQTATRTAGNVFGIFGAGVTAAADIAAGGSQAAMTAPHDIADAVVAGPETVLRTIGSAYLEGAYAATAALPAVFPQTTQAASTDPGERGRGSPYDPQYEGRSSCGSEQYRIVGFYHQRDGQAKPPLDTGCQPILAVAPGLPETVNTFGATNFRFAKQPGGDYYFQYENVASSTYPAFHHLRIIIEDVGIDYGTSFTQTLPESARWTFLGSASTSIAGVSQYFAKSRIAVDYRIQEATAGTGQGQPVRGSPTFIAFTVWPEVSDPTNWYDVLLGEYAGRSRFTGGFERSAPNGFRATVSWPELADGLRRIDFDFVRTIVGTENREPVPGVISFPVGSEPLSLRFNQLPSRSEGRVEVATAGDGFVRAEGSHFSLSQPIKEFEIGIPGADNVKGIQLRNLIDIETFTYKSVPLTSSTDPRACDSDGAAMFDAWNGWRHSPVQRCIALKGVNRDMVATIGLEHGSVVVSNFPEDPATAGPDSVTEVVFGPGTWISAEVDAVRAAGLPNGVTVVASDVVFEEQRIDYLRFSGLQGLQFLTGNDAYGSPPVLVQGTFVGSDGMVSVWGEFSGTLVETQMRHLSQAVIRLSHDQHPVRVWVKSLGAASPGVSIDGLHVHYKKPDDIELDLRSGSGWGIRELDFYVLSGEDPCNLPNEHQTDGCDVPIHLDRLQMLVGGRINLEGHLRKVLPGAPDFDGDLDLMVQRTRSSETDIVRADLKTSDAGAYNGRRMATIMRGMWDEATIRVYTLDIIHLHVASWP